MIQKRAFGSDIATHLLMNSCGHFRLCRSRRRRRNSSKSRSSYFVEPALPESSLTSEEVSFGGIVDEGRRILFGEVVSWSKCHGEISKHLLQTTDCNIIPLASFWEASGGHIVTLVPFQLLCCADGSRIFVSLPGFWYLGAYLVNWKGNSLFSYTEHVFV